MLFSRFYLGEFAMVDSWKDKRISAMNRVIKRKGRSTLDYLDEYDSVCLSKCKNKKKNFVISCTLFCKNEILCLCNL